MVTPVNSHKSYYIARVCVSHREKSCPVNQIVIIAVFASSSSVCFNSLIISNDQSSSRPMNEILAWQHLFVTTIILSVCCGLRKYSNNSTCCSFVSRKTLIILPSHGQRSIYTVPMWSIPVRWSPSPLIPWHWLIIPVTIQAINWPRVWSLWSCQCLSRGLSPLGVTRRDCGGGAATLAC